MDNKHRSGFDRRLAIMKFPDNKRKSEERRDLICHQKMITYKVKNTPIFKDLTDKQFIKILNICSKKTYSRNEVIYYEGDVSDTILVLVEGVLEVTLKGNKINLISPIGLVGEMGVFTHERRSATIIAKNDCTVYQITSVELKYLFSRDEDLQRKLLFGMLIDLANKLRLSNEVIAKMKNKIKSSNIL
ncbi:MAG: cyclic nucleotide-binding domain-containing protein [Candidatus Latescibacteria bacterium]|jgi:CRP-like cAMP-binding protein|nr:cyclic nucleotide-binding domain-containing protein [Candidatus Latescibacterota bacterium]